MIIFLFLNLAAFGNQEVKWIHFSDDNSFSEAEIIFHKYRLLPIKQISNPLRYSIHNQIEEDEKVTDKIKAEPSVLSIGSNSNPIGQQIHYSPWGLSSTERNKWTWYLGGGSTLLMTAWGTAAWKWGKDKQRFNLSNEGWFDRNTYSGGIDKIGHMFSFHFQKRTLNWILLNMGWGFESANNISALVAMGLGIVVEFGDGFSHYGFAFDDLTFNTIGIATAYLFDRYPWLDQLVGFRFEWWPGSEYKNRRGDNKIDFSSDYNRMKFYTSIKAAGIPLFNRSWYTRYLTLDFGLYTRGYRAKNYESFDHGARRRYWSIGMGINLGTLVFDLKPENKIARTSATFFKYWIPPEVTHGVNSKI